MRAIEGSSTAELAAKLLVASTAFMQLTHEEAFTVVSDMTPRKIAEGTTFTRGGDESDTGCMMLLLETSVTVENIVVSRHTPVTVTVLGPGSLIGEVGLVDGRAWLASCTASIMLRCSDAGRPRKTGSRRPAHSHQTDVRRVAAHCRAAARHV